MKNIPNIILASKSPRRKEMLEHLGLKPTVIVSNADENVSESLSPERFVKEVSLRKAEAVRPLCKDGDLIIASDTVVVCDGRILGKPHGEKEALEMLSLLSGTTHKVISGLALIYNGRTVLSHETTEVTFRALAEEEIRAYVATGEPMDKAGAYGIQGKGGSLVAGYNGEFDTVVGFNMTLLRALMHEAVGDVSSLAEDGND